MAKTATRKTAKKTARKTKTTRKVAKKTAKKGRPSGTKNHDCDRVEVVVSRCMKCDSTERAPYHGTKELKYSGATPDGREYNRVFWRKTVCLVCGQHRIDKSYGMVTTEA